MPGNEMERHREKNRVAQKRFRERQKARMRTSAQQVQELTARMDALLREKAELEARNHVLQHTVDLSTQHFGEVFAQEARRSKIALSASFGSDV